MPGAVWSTPPSRSSELSVGARRPNQPPHAIRLVIPRVFYTKKKGERKKKGPLSRYQTHPRRHARLNNQSRRRRGKKKDLVILYVPSSAESLLGIFAPFDQQWNQREEEESRL